MTEVPHATVHFTGRVQGVGFRYATLQIAREFEVAGYVKNLADGRVLLEAEGPDAELTAFVDEVEDRLSSYIRKTERETGRRPAGFRGFEIR